MQQGPAFWSTSGFRLEQRCRPLTPQQPPRRFEGCLGFEDPRVLALGCFRKAGSSEFTSLCYDEMKRVRVHDDP